MSLTRICYQRIWVWSYANSSLDWYDCKSACRFDQKSFWALLKHGNIIRSRLFLIRGGLKLTWSAGKNPIVVESTYTLFQSHFFQRSVRSVIIWSESIFVGDLNLGKHAIYASNAILNMFKDTLATNYITRFSLVIKTQVINFFLTLQSLSSFKSWK